MPPHAHTVHESVIPASRHSLGAAAVLGNEPLGGNEREREGAQGVGIGNFSNSGRRYCLCTHRQLQGFVQEAVALAVQVRVGAACLGHSDPGEPGFLWRRQTS